MKITRTRLDIGLPNPLSFLHSTDNHLSYVDDRDDERKRDLAAKRHRAFEGDSNRCTVFLDEMIAYAKDHCDLFLHTGDLLDFVSYRNLEVSKEKLDQVDYFMAVGAITSPLNGSGFRPGSITQGWRRSQESKKSSSSPRRPRRHSPQSQKSP